MAVKSTQRPPVTVVTNARCGGRSAASAISAPPPSSAAAPISSAAASVLCGAYSVVPTTMASTQATATTATGSTNRVGRRSRLRSVSTTVISTAASTASHRSGVGGEAYHDVPVIITRVPSMRSGMEIAHRAVVAARRRAQARLVPAEAGRLAYLLPDRRAVQAAAREREDARRGGARRALVAVDASAAEAQHRLALDAEDDDLTARRDDESEIDVAARDRRLEAGHGGLEAAQPRLVVARDRGRRAAMGRGCGCGQEQDERRGEAREETDVTGACLHEIAEAAYVCLVAGTLRDMNRLSTIVDLERYPMDRLESAEGSALVLRVRSALGAVGACDLPGFLRPEAVSAAVASALSVRGEAYRTDQDPRRRVLRPAARVARGGRSAPGTHPLGQGGHGARSHSGRRPRAGAVRVRRPSAFIGAALQVDPIFRSDDPLGALNLMYYPPGDTLGWHFDNADFVVTLLLQAPEAGGAFEFVPMLRGLDDRNDDGVRALLAGERDRIQSMSGEAGTLALFRGHWSPHESRPSRAGACASTRCSHMPAPRVTG